MKSFWISFFGILVSSFFLGWIGSWWIVFVPCFVFGMLVNRKPATAFWSGFWAIAILWKLLSLYLLGADTVQFHEQVLRIFTSSLDLPPTLVLIFVIAIIGGLAGGLSAWAGQALRKLF